MQSAKNLPFMSSFHFCLLFMMTWKSPTFLLFLAMSSLIFRGINMWQSWRWPAFSAWPGNILTTAINENCVMVKWRTWVACYSMKFHSFVMTNKHSAACAHSLNLCLLWLVFMELHAFCLIAIDISMYCICTNLPVAKYSLLGCQQ